MPFAGLLTPLRRRDFRLLWLGMTISLIGDGIYLVALAWQVYDLTDSPAALSLVGLSWSIGMVGFLLVGGARADRVDRKRLLISADLVRLVCLAAMGVLAVSGVVEVWHLVLLSLVYGIAEAFFSPAFTALIPQLVEPEDLVQANALQEVVRPAMLRLAGPALGGLLVGAFGAGTAFLVDAGTFVVGIACVAAIRSPGVIATAAQVSGGVREGLAWARHEPWFWATLIAAALSIMLTVGPQEVLLPLVVRKDLDASASAYGLVLAAGGVGGIIGGLWMSHRGLPGRKLRFLYVAWGLAVVMIAGYAVATAIWQLALMTFVFGAGIACGMVVWATMMQRRVPEAMMGRVTALDWAVSIGLSPLSFAVTGPVAALAGHDATLLLGGLLGAVATFAIYLALPALRADDTRALRAALDGLPDPADAVPSARADRGQVVEEAGVGHRGGLHADHLDSVLGR